MKRLVKMESLKQFVAVGVFHKHPVFSELDSVIPAKIAIQLKNKRIIIKLARSVRTSNSTTGHYTAPYSCSVLPASGSLSL